MSGTYYYFKTNYKTKLENSLTKIDSVFKQTVKIKRIVNNNNMILKNVFKQTQQMLETLFQNLMINQVRELNIKNEDFTTKVSL